METNNNLTERTCDYCGSKYKLEVGATKANWDKLFRKPTLNEMIELFIIIMVIVAAFAYKVDMANMKAYYEETCSGFDNNIDSRANTLLALNNLTNDSCLTNSGLCTVKIGEDSTNG